MTVYATVGSPLGELLLVGEERAGSAVALASLSMPGQKGAAVVQEGWVRAPELFAGVAAQLAATHGHWVSESRVGWNKTYLARLDAFLNVRQPNAPPEKSRRVPSFHWDPSSHCHGRRRFKVPSTCRKVSLKSDVAPQEKYTTMYFASVAARESMSRSDVLPAPRSPKIITCDL